MGCYKRPIWCINWINNLVHNQKAELPNHERIIKEINTEAKNHLEQHSAIVVLVINCKHISYFLHHFWTNVSNARSNILPILDSIVDFYCLFPDSWPVALKPPCRWQLLSEHDWTSLDLSTPLPLKEHGDVAESVIYLQGTNVQ